MTEYALLKAKKDLETQEEYNGLQKKIVESEVGNKKLRELNTEIAGKKFNLDLSNTESSKFEPGASSTSEFKLPPRSQEGGTTALKTFRSMSNLRFRPIITELITIKQTSLN